MESLFDVLIPVLSVCALMTQIGSSFIEDDKMGKALLNVAMLMLWAVLMMVSTYLPTG